MRKLAAARPVDRKPRGSRRARKVRTARCRSQLLGCHGGGRHQIRAWQRGRGRRPDCRDFAGRARLSSGAGGIVRRVWRRAAGARHFRGPARKPCRTVRPHEARRIRACDGRRAEGRRRRGRPPGVQCHRFGHSIDHSPGTGRERHAPRAEVRRAQRASGIAAVIPGLRRRRRRGGRDRRRGDCAGSGRTADSEPRERTGDPRYDGEIVEDAPGSSRSDAVRWQRADIASVGAVLGWEPRRDLAHSVAAVWRTSAGW
jgi:hypothetical protein